ncbi:hypothetical protein CC80DRAFT_532545 [Byssothecium circinans]|uniref:Zn(2)-C6 fungal-type domain-containing protein n=1 Tax=Byssothecium circinans TaxID=147558 RepID=A0A6A5UDM5_9PLEO|nr:hypothetical protein CC80DRAFT_532545 [Byssothecium circinans]
MPRRIKACAICRQKRIKCDATMPHCTMCQKFGRQCPGPTEAPLLFIDNSSFPSGRKPKKPRNKPISAENKKSSAYLPSPEASSPESRKSGIDTTDEESGGEELPYEVAFDMVVTVSPRYVLHEAFYANFLSFFCAEGRHIPGSVRRTPTWLHALAPLSSKSSRLNALPKQTDESKNALSLALRATTAAFSGVETRNPSLVEHAAGLYGAALREHGKALSAQWREKGSGGELEMLGTSIMLSMFEAVVATTGTAYAEHIIGAAKMIETILKKVPKPTTMLNDGPPPPGARGGRGGRGGGLPGRGGSSLRGRGGGPPPPGNTGGAGLQPLHTGIFFHLRFQLAFVHLTTTQDKLRRDPVMRTVLEDCCGWDFDKLPLMQQVLRPLTRLTRLLCESDANPSYAARPRMEKTYRDAKEEVDALWEKYQREGKMQKLCWTGASGQMDFRDPFTALQYAYFSACRILLDIVAPRCGQKTGPTLIPIRQGSPSSPPSLSMSSTQSAPSISTSSLQPQHPLTTTSSTSSSNQPHPTSSPPSSSSPAITDHYALILSVAWYLRLRDVGFSYLRLHSPLFLVAMYAPKMGQRRIARMIFEEWRDGALRGIGVLGLDRI